MHAKLNDLVKICSELQPHLKTSGPTYRLSFTNKCTILYYCGLEHIADRSTKSLHATEILLIPNASNLIISLTLKTKAVTKYDSIRL